MLAFNDARYYTQAQSNALYAGATATVFLTGAQIIDGIKTFLRDLIVQKLVPSVELQHSDGTKLARFAASSAPNAVYLSVWDTGAWRNILSYVLGDKFDVPADDIYTKGKKVATQEYVDARLKSGLAFLSGQTASLTAGIQGYTQVNSIDQVFAIPAGSRITRISVRKNDDTVPTDTTCSVTATSCKISITPGGAVDGVVAITSASGVVLFTSAGAKGAGIFVATLTIST